MDNRSFNHRKHSFCTYMNVPIHWNNLPTPTEVKELSWSSSESSFVTILSPERSVSLCSALKKPYRQSDKKVVHFADSLGLDLVDVRLLHNVSDSTDDIFGRASPQQDEICGNFWPGTSPFRETAFKMAMPRFHSIYLHLHFTTIGRFEWKENRTLNEKLVKQTLTSGVRLMSVNTIGTTITGIISVANFYYKKEVWVRYTMDRWRSWTEVPAMYVSSYMEQQIDTFSFSIFLPQNIPVGAQCEFCIRYDCGGDELWDSNNSANYMVECRSLDDVHDEGYQSLDKYDLVGGGR